MEGNVMSLSALSASSDCTCYSRTYESAGVLTELDESFVALPKSPLPRLANLDDHVPVDERVSRVCSTQSNAQNPGSQQGKEVDADKSGHLSSRADQAKEAGNSQDDHQSGVEAADSLGGDGKLAAA